MPRAETFAFLDAAAKLDPPSLILSGGEPLAHPDFSEILGYAASLSLRLSLSTNGTLIDACGARFLKEKKVGYAGVSLDGPEAVHDVFRGMGGAFGKTLAGIRCLKNAGVRVGLRFTMARTLLSAIPDLLRIAEDLEVDRVCFYHFIPSGRGRAETELVPTREDTRAALFRLFEWTEKGEKTPREVLTVGNFSDGVLLYLCLAKRGDSRSARVLDMIGRSGGGRSGRGLVSVRWDGALFADQFSWGLGALGRWTELEKLSAEPVRPLGRFRGRCGRCRWLPICRGNMRARAAAAGDPWGEDPGCVLSEEEISKENFLGP